MATLWSYAATSECEDEDDGDNGGDGGSKPPVKWYTYQDAAGNTRAGNRFDVVVKVVLKDFLFLPGMVLDDDGTITQDDIDQCSNGTSRCACYGNATCNAGLRCHSGQCVPSDCVDGALDCPCDGDTCTGDGLVCYPWVEDHDR